jgi:hypothetical protein
MTSAGASAVPPHARQRSVVVSVEGMGYELGVRYCEVPFEYYTTVI